MTVIAMTREIGSHGSEVAAGVAAALGLEIINSEIVVPHVAETLGVEQSAVQRYMNGKASLFDRWQIDTRKLGERAEVQIERDHRQRHFCHQRRRISDLSLCCNEFQ
jgi:hypothetical protein